MRIIVSSEVGLPSLRKYRPRQLRLVSQRARLVASARMS